VKEAKPQVVQAHPKIYGINLGKIPENCSNIRTNLAKICENFRKILKNLGKLSENPIKNGAQLTLI